MGAAIFLKDTTLSSGDGRYRNHSIEELIVLFNKEVGQQAWVSARARHLHNLAIEFRHRGLGADTVLQGNSLSLNRKIQLCASGDNVEYITSSE